MCSSSLVIYVFHSRVSGYMMTDKLEVPRRRVKKNWYVGLDLDPVDRSHPDVHDDQLVLEASEKKSESRKLNVGFITVCTSGAAYFICFSVNLLLVIWVSCLRSLFSLSFEALLSWFDLPLCLYIWHRVHKGCQWFELGIWTWRSWVQIF